MEEIDPEGRHLPGNTRRQQRPPKPLARWARKPYALIYGASHAFHRDVFCHFGPLHEGRMIEDNPMAVRAMALDGIYYLDRPLVRYRRHADNVASRLNDKGFRQYVTQEARRHALLVQTLEQVLRDLPHPAFVQKFGRKTVQLALVRCRRAIRLQQLLADWKGCSESRVPWALVKSAWSFPCHPVIGLRLLVRRLLPFAYEWLTSRHERQWRRANSFQKD